MTKYIGLLTLLVAAAGCGSSESKTTTEEYRYEFSQNGCETGKHSFASQDSLCAGLQNENLNQGCAANLRRDDFERRCAGRTWNPS